MSKKLIDFKDKAKHTKYKIHIDDSVLAKDDVIVGLHSNIWSNVIIGKNVILGRKVTIYENTIIGDNVTIGDFSTIGYNVSIGNGVILPTGSVIEDGVTLNDSFNIQGSKHLVTYYGNNKMSLGCVVDTVDNMLKRYKKLGIDYNYTKEQIKEYGKYIKQIKLKTKT